MRCNALLVDVLNTFIQVETIIKMFQNREQIVKRNEREREREKERKKEKEGGKERERQQTNRPRNVKQQGAVMRI